MKLTVTGAKFGDLVVCFLLDKLQHPDSVLEYDVNEKFNALVEVLMRRGMKAPLFQYYMNIDAQTRTNYRMIRNVFRDVPGSDTAYIEIVKDERKAAMEPGVFDRIKKFAKKLLIAVAVAAVVKKIAGKPKETEDNEQA
jgi:hypothetical protein